MATCLTKWRLCWGECLSRPRQTIIDLSREISEHLREEPLKYDLNGTRAYAKKLAALGLANAARDEVLAFEQRRKVALPVDLASAVDENAAEDDLDFPETKEKQDMRAAHHRGLWLAVLGAWAKKGQQRRGTPYPRDDARKTVGAGIWSFRRYATLQP